jgi:16S rRNA G1207 methylase RsmC
LVRRIIDMPFEDRQDDPLAVDEGSWVYLSNSLEGDEQGARLHDRVAEACEASGWPAVWSPAERKGRASDPGRFFESVRHAVEDADAVVAFIGRATEMTNAELTLAYSHRRPIVGICLADEDDSGIRSILQGYERARVITCADPDECATSLRATFADPEFAETIRRAATHGENV